MRREAVARFDALCATEKQHQSRLDAIEHEAGQVALRAQELARRFALTTEVPCSGTDLQGRCTLLGDAREAKALKPAADARLAQLNAEHAEVLAQLCSTKEALIALNDPTTRSLKRYSNTVDTAKIDVRKPPFLEVGL